MIDIKRMKKHEE